MWIGGDLKAENANTCAICALNYITPFTSELTTTEDFSYLIFVAIDPWEYELIQNTYPNILFQKYLHCMR